MEGWIYMLETLVEEFQFLQSVAISKPFSTMLRGVQWFSQRSEQSVSLAWKPSKYLRVKEY